MRRTPPWRVDRDHAHRRAPDVRGRAGQSRGESLADAPRPGPGRARPSRLHPRHLGHWRNTLPLVSIANTKALERAGIGRDTRPPAPSIEIERDAHGDPTGVLVEQTYKPLVEHTLMAVAPRFTLDDRVAGLAESMRIYNRCGTTSVFEGHGISNEVLAAYQAPARAGPAERAGASLVEPGLAVRRCRARARPRAELGRLAEPPRARRRVPARGRALHGIGLLGGEPPARGHRAPDGLGRLLLPGGPARGRHGRDDDRGREKPHPRRQLHAEYPRPLRASEPRRAHRGPAVGHRAYRRLRPG